MTKTVVITGGTKGIGRGLVRAFAERGCRVVYCGRSETSIPGATGRRKALWRFMTAFRKRQVMTAP